MSKKYRIPNTKAQYEQEIIELERDRGNQLRWVRPNGQWVLKTNRKGPVPSKLFGDRNSSLGNMINSDQVYINLASSAEIDQPESEFTEKNGKIGTLWKLPHTLTLPRPDALGSDQVGLIVDVVFHPSAFEKKELHQLLQDTALDSVESKCHLSIDRKKIEKVKGLHYYGTPVNTTIKEPLKNATKELETNKQFLKEMEEKGSQPIPPPASNTADASSNTLNGSPKKIETPSTPQIEEPKIQVIHQDELKLTNYISRDLAPSSQPHRPEKLILRIDLPKLKQIDQLSLKIQSDQLLLSVPDLYHTVFTLPYPVDDEKVQAQWLVDKKQLQLSCPVSSSLKKNT